MTSQRPTRLAAARSKSAITSAVTRRSAQKGTGKRTPRRSPGRQAGKNSLPKIGCMVSLWFSGYDRYYKGSVREHTPPNVFTVVLKDGSVWPVDRVNNIWKYVSLKDDPSSVEYVNHVVEYEEEDDELDSALASDSDALRPIRERMDVINEKVDSIQGEIKDLYGRVAKFNTRDTTVTRDMENNVSKAALDALRSDLSEMIGGGEARIKGYNQMSQSEFDAFEDLLKENAKQLIKLASMIVDARKEHEQAEREEAEKKKNMEKEEKQKEKEAQNDDDGDQEMVDANQEAEGAEDEGAEKVNETQLTEAPTQSTGNGTFAKPVTRDPKDVAKRVNFNSA